MVAAGVRSHACFSLLLSFSCESDTACRGSARFCFLLLSTSSLRAIPASGDRGSAAILFLLLSTSSLRAIPALVAAGRRDFVCERFLHPGRPGSGIAPERTCAATTRSGTSPRRKSSGHRKRTPRTPTHPEAFRYSQHSQHSRSHSERSPARHRPESAAKHLHHPPPSPPSPFLTQTQPSPQPKPHARNQKSLQVLIRRQRQKLRKFLRQSDPFEDLPRLGRSPLVPHFFPDFLTDRRHFLVEHGSDSLP
jgi:hypothetical protein